VTAVAEFQGHSRRGREEWASTDGWSQQSLCGSGSPSGKPDDRFIQRDLSEGTIAELILICVQCPVRQRCLLWAEAQTQPVGFAVAGGKRWKAWNHCAICGKKVRGIDRCPAHAEVGEPIGTIRADGTSAPFTVLDNH
jgi:hypothetical protein